MSRGISAVISKQFGYLIASKVYGVPKSTLERRVKGCNKIATEAKKILGHGKTTLRQELEQKLYEHILVMEERLFGLTVHDVRRLAC